MKRVVNALREFANGEEEVYPSIQVDEELHGEINKALDSLTDDNGGPLLLIRPPRENDGMDASISVYETLHNPREKKVGFGPFTAIQNKAHAHAHEIWYHGAQMQFFLRPETRVDANKVRRQVRSNYRNVDIQEVDNRFPSVDIGEYISVAEIGLKRDFYFPIKAKLHNDDNFDLDPYGDITSDMVVEEDETSDGQRVEAKDCKLVVQTIFEAARNVWSSSRPYGVDVNNVAQGMKEGEVHGNMIKGFDTRNPSALRKKTAKILETLQGSKAYYITMRVIAISPYEEIAQRRCRNVAQDFETYYNSVTQQGLTPIELTEDEMREKILDAARREHEYGFRDRFLSTGKFVQPVEALGAIAHIPNEDINTPVVDWAKQDTGPGTPSSGTQLEDEERQQQQVDDSGVGTQIDMDVSSPPEKPGGGENQDTPLGTDPSTGDTASKTDNGVEAELNTTEDRKDERSDNEKPNESDDIRSGWGVEDVTASEEEDTVDTGVDGGSDAESSRSNTRSIDEWGTNEVEDEGGKSSESTTDNGWATSEVDDSESDDGDATNESKGSTPAFAAGNDFDDGWGEESDQSDGAGRRR